MGVSIKLNITQNNQSIANNTSNVTVKLICSWDYGSFNHYSPKGTVTIDGTTYNFSANINPNKTTSGSNTIYSKTLNIAHNSEGKKTLSCSAVFNTGISAGSLEVSASKTLTTIARKATITEAPNFNDEANPAIKYSNPSGSAASTLQVAIYNSDASKAIAAYRDVTKTGTSYTFNLTDTERSNILDAIGNNKAASVRFYIRTVLSGTTYTHYVTKTVSLINATPTINPTIKDTSAKTLALTGSPDAFIKGYSWAKVDFGAVGRKGATIRSVSCTNGNLTLYQDGGVMQDIEYATFKLRVVDSRGYATEQNYIVNPFINFKKVTCALTHTEFTSDGIINFTVKGNYFNGSFSTSKVNSLLVQYRYKTQDGNYSTWVTANPIINASSYTANVTISELDYQTKYIIQVRAADGLSAAYSNEPVLSCVPVFDWGSEDFNFNVDVSLANNYRIMGTTTDGQKLNAFQPANQNNNCVIGYGGYDNNIGATHIYGDTVRLYSNNPVELNNKPIGANKLWGGAYYMSEGHTIDLAEPVSAQFSGIVLVFSRYDIANGEALNEHFSYHFVPKLVVEEQSDRGSIFNMSTSNETFSASKYLYITDTQIRGHANNVATGTGATGVKYENNRFVLRYVIGV